MNTFGQIFRISIFGESHGNGVGAVIDGIPAGISLNEKDFEHDILRRKSGARGTTPRKEDDMPMIMSGVLGGYATGAPLAIMFPETRFKLIDGTGKKILVVKEVAKSIGLTNCEAEHTRGENEDGKYDFVVSRAVMPLPDLVKLVKKNIGKTQHNALPNGLLCLKGGNINEEIKPFKHIVDVMELSTMFDEEWFKQKYLIYLPL